MTKKFDENYNKPMVDKGQELGQNIIDTLNSYSFDPIIAGVVAKVMVSHLTLQQSVGRLIVALIEGFATQKYVDDRNAATIELCKKLNKITKDTHLPFI